MTYCFIEIDKQSVIEIELFDNSVAKKFLKQLKWHVSNSSINHKEAFYGYADELSIRHNLLDSINVINNFINHEFIKLPADINWDDSFIYNHLHEYFEKLNGEWGKPSRLFSIATPNVKDAIRNLNFSIHRLETRPYQLERTFYLSWNKNTYKRESFDEDDYQYFTDSYSSNTVYLAYTEVGKHLMELYYDGLTPEYNAYKNLHFVGAEIKLDWDMTDKEIFTSDFKRWANKYGIDLTNKKLGVGVLPVGKFKGSDKNFTKDSKVTNIMIKEI